ncbi:hypothetical protein [Helicobacter cetorum]|nr:hypothetical protein [Helicobacter cetorum]
MKEVKKKKAKREVKTWFAPKSVVKRPINAKLPMFSSSNLK